MKQFSSLFYLYAGLLLLLSIFMLYPLLYVAIGSVVDKNSLSFDFFQILFTTPYLRQVIVNSLVLACIVSLATVAIAVPLTLAIVRLSLPLKTTLHTLLLLPLILPPFVGVIGIKQLLGRFGSVNLALLDYNIIQMPIDWLAPGRMFGVVVLEVLHLVPLLYLTFSASLLSSDRSLEEAASMAGASPMNSLFRITLPLAWPGLLAGIVLAFVSSFTDLGTPLLLEYRHVVPVQVFGMLNDLNVNHVGFALVVLVSCISIFLFVFSQELLPKQELALIHVARAHAHQKNQSSWITFVVASLILAYAIIACLPHIGVVLTSLSSNWFMTVLPTHYTLDNFWLVLKHPVTYNSIKNSLFLSVSATLIIVALATCVGFISVRTALPGKQILEVLALLPLAIPGIVFAVGYLGAFSGTLLDPIKNPLPLLIIAYSVRRLPVMVRSAVAGIKEAHPMLLEAGRSMGANSFVVSVRILLPLVSRHIIAGALLTFTYCMLEVSDSLFLAREEKFFPISKALYTLLGRPDGVELASALGVLVMILVTLSFFLANKLARRR